MTYAGPATYDEIQKMLSGSKFSKLLHSCGSCGKAYVSSADSMASLSCVACGAATDYGNSLMRGRKARAQQPK